MIDRSPDWPNMPSSVNVPSSERADVGEPRFPDDWNRRQRIEEVFRVDLREPLRQKLDPPDD